MKTPSPRRSFLLRAVALGALASPWAASAQDYPAKPIHLVVPVGPGGGTDTVARLLAEELRPRLRQPVIVENRAGGAGNSIGAEYVARAAPDGYTLLVASAGPLANQKSLYPNAGFEPLDFTPIALIAEIPNVLVAPPEAPFKSVREAIAYAKANPGKLDYASSGSGSSNHLAMEMLKMQSGLDIQHVPYKGTAQQTTALLGGQVNLGFLEMSTAWPHVTAGKLRVLGVGTATRVASLPDVPSIQETLPGFVTTVWFGLVAPPKTPPAIASQLSATVGDIMKQSRLLAKLQSMKFQPMDNTSAEMTKFVRQEQERWDKVIRTAKITPD
jgi:tripartite-type tricarboxylate transporter receptor subunit TctC